jgi:glucose-1-phosphate thymidylyltransferase
MTTTRALVLARGLGTRMRTADPDASLTAEQQEAANAGMKAMMPIAGRPFLDFVLSALADAAVRHVGLVVAPDHSALRAYYEAAAPPARLTLDFIVQPEPRGTADAVLSAESWSRQEPVLVVNGDNLYPATTLRELIDLDEPALPGFDAHDLVQSSNIEPARISAFALIETDADGYLTRIVEKPSAADAAHAGDRPKVSMNCWRFDARIFDACRDVPRSPRGELELPAAVGLAANRGMRLRVIPARGPVLDLSQRADAAEVTRRLSGITPHP